VKAEPGMIFTWYKFLNVSIMSQASKCEPCDAVAPPANLLPIDKTEFAVAVPGGTATIAGVAVTVRAGDPLLKPNERYLVFLNGVQGPDRTGVLARPEWAFRVSADGGLIQVVGKRSLLSDDVLSFGSLDAIREHIRMLHAKPTSAGSKVGVAGSTI